MRSEEWYISDIVEIINKMREGFIDEQGNKQEGKYDCIIMIDGKRGVGKSTLGAKIAYRLGFNPERDIVYSREDVIKAYAKKKNGVIFADEFINVGYNRDFWDSDQKTLIKLMNMYRDSKNVFIGCVPIFAQLDRHFQSLVKIRLTVIERGIAIVQGQLRSSIYTSDPWDIKNNIKIESSWSLKNKNPQYQKLTTFRGFLYFEDLTQLQREEIEKIKQEKRNRLVQIDEGRVEEEDWLKKLLDKVIAKELTNQIFLAYCQLTGRDANYVRNRINENLRNMPESMNKTLSDWMKEAEEKINPKKPKRFNI
jgi:signal recognition particle GTPase